MLVRDRMSAPPVTIDVNGTIREARAIMRHFDIRRVPVVRRGRLAGIVSWTDLVRGEGPQATTWGVPWGVLKVRVHEIMTPDPVTIQADAPIEYAAVLMRTRKIGGLPVMDNGALCGIITESDIFDAFVELTGMRQGGSRILVDVTAKQHSVYDMVVLLQATGVALSSLATYEHDGRQLALLRTKGAPRQQVLDALSANGYPILHYVERWQNDTPAVRQHAAPKESVLPS
jgi:acetoin utilization protein AcuB